MKTFCYLFSRYTTLELPSSQMLKQTLILNTLINPVAQVAYLVDTGIEMYLVTDDDKNTR